MLGELLRGLVPGEFGRSLADYHLEVRRFSRFDEEAGQRAARVVRQNQVVVGDMLSSLCCHVLFRHFNLLYHVTNGKFDLRGQPLVLLVGNHA